MKTDLTITIHASLDLIYSPDDAAATGKGWYFQDLDDDAVSICYRSKQEALVAYKNDKIKWESR